MSTISKAYQLIINGNLPGGRNSLLKSITDGNSISEKPVWMQGDKCLIQLFFRAPGDPGEPSTSLSLDESFSMILSCALFATPLVPLFAVSDWTKKGESDVYYEGILDLNTEALAAVFAVNADSEELSLPVDIEVRNVGNTTRITYRADIAMARQVYDGSSAATSIAYGTCTAPDGGIWQLGVTNDGQPQFTKVA